MGTPSRRDVVEDDGESLLQKDSTDLTQHRVSRARRALTDTVARTAIRCGLLILTWYFLSTALSIFNKKLVGKKHGIFGHGAFPAPLLLTGVQFAFQHVLARVVFAAGLMERTAVKLPWKDWCRLVLPNGTVTGLDIGFSNTSLVYITMSFYTMCKSTTPIFLLAFAFLWRLETPSWGLAGVVAVIVSGLLLLVHGEAEFNLTGFLLVMSASCMSGLRFTLTQLLLHGHHGVADHGPAPFGGPLEVLEVLTPVMSVTTLLLSLATERLWHTLPPSPYFSTWQHFCITMGLILVGAIIAFLMVWTEYQVIKETSALTFMIAGTIKEVVTVITSIAVFGDQFGVINGIGLVVVIAGVLLFNYYKLLKLRASLRQQITHSKDGGGAGTAVELVEQGVPIQLVAVGSTGSQLAAAAAGLGSGDSFSGVGGLLQQQRRRSGSSSMPAAGGADDEEGGGSSGGVLRALEFEPLLPMSGVMVRR